MKKNLFFAFALVAALASCSKGGDYKISVTFADDSANGKTAYLTSYDSGDTIDSAVVANRSAEFQGKAEESYFSRLIVDGSRMGFVVEPGDISIAWGDQKATGTALNEKLNKCNEELNAIEEEYGKLQEKLEKGEITEDQYDAAVGGVDKKESDCFYKVYADNKDNGIGPWAFNYYLMLNDFTVAQIDSLLAESPKTYSSLKRVEKSKNDAKQKELTGVGKKITDFSIKTEDGKTIKLSDYVGKGEYVVVDFWASWCGPCRKAIKEALKPIHDKYAGKGLKVLGVAVWDAPADTRKAIEDLQIPWDVMIGDKKLTEPTDLYGVSGIPHIMIVDPQGVIVSRGLDGKELISKVDELMKK
jgi:thiol-disulfide isomerase/thioredoxin